MFSMQSLKCPCVHWTNSRLGKSSTLTKHESVPAALLALNQPLSNSYADIYTYACIHTGSESHTLHTHAHPSSRKLLGMKLNGFTRLFTGMSSLASLYKYRSTYVSNKIIFVEHKTSLLSQLFPAVLAASEHLRLQAWLFLIGPAHTWRQNLYKGQHAIYRWQDVS